jgi:uncharacterized membrane protein YgdD (TMEM256/DUF423 family)
MNWAVAGAGLMAAAVAVGAFAAHALKARLTPEMFQVFEVGVRYHVYHALGLFIVAWISTVRTTGLVNAAGFCFLGGILLFSGALYLYALSGAKALAMLAPIGGTLFIVGWVLLGCALRKGA